MDPEDSGRGRPSGEKSDAWRRARSRVNSYKTEAALCQRVRDDAVAMLEVFAERMAEMVESGQIGRRLGADAQSYPQLRIVYWGEIESGSMNLLCIEADYGGADKARVGVWAKLRSAWDCAALEGPLARLGAWRRGWRLGQPDSAEALWREVRACLRTLSLDLEMDLDFGPPAELSLEAGPSPSKVDEKAWGDWLASEGPGITMFPSLPATEGEPSEVEWMMLEIRAKSILAGFKRQGQGAPDASEPPSMGPGQDEG